MKWFKSRQGGLWVGGILYIYNDRVQFVPNAPNRALQTGELCFDIDWRTVATVSWRPGVITGVIEVSHDGRTEAVRCFSSRKVAGLMTRLREASVG